VSRHRGSRITAGLVAGLVAGLALLAAPAAQADASDLRIPVNVLVTYLSNDGSGVDASARRLDEKLRGQFKYDSLQVLEQRRVELEIDGVGEVALPNGRKARMSAISKSDAGVLIAVDVEGAAKMDARVQNHHLLVIRAGRYKQGDLVLSLEPDYR
jgi:hypothetical protein